MNNLIFVPESRTSMYASEWIPVSFLIDGTTLYYYSPKWKTDIFDEVTLKKKAEQNINSVFKIMDMKKGQLILSKTWLFFRPSSGSEFRVEFKDNNTAEKIFEQISAFNSYSVSTRKSTLRDRVPLIYLSLILIPFCVLLMPYGMVVISSVFSSLAAQILNLDAKALFDIIAKVLIFMFIGIGILNVIVVFKILLTVNEVKYINID